MDKSERRTDAVSGGLMRLARAGAPGFPVRGGPAIAISDGLAGPDACVARAGAVPPQACRKGSLRGVCPVKARQAFPTAGATGGVPGSPIPVGLSMLSTIETVTSGISD